MPTHSRFRACFLILLVLLSAAAVSSQRRSRSQGPTRHDRPRAPVAAAPAAPTPPDAPTDLICQTYCSATKLRTVVAEIAWKVSDTELSASAFSARVGEQELEVATVKDGFTRGTYINLFSMERHPSFRVHSADPASGNSIPGLEGLVVVGVGRLGDESNQNPDDQSPFSFERFGVRPFGESDAEAVVVKIEGLEPGRNYFWRVPATVRGRRVTSEVVQCKAPQSCPADTRRGRQEQP